MFNFHIVYIYIYIFFLSLRYVSHCILDISCLIFKTPYVVYDIHYIIHIVYDMETVIYYFQI